MWLANSRKIANSPERAGVDEDTSSLERSTSAASRVEIAASSV